MSEQSNFRRYRDELFFKWKVGEIRKSSIWFITSVFLFLSLVTYHSSDPSLNTASDLKVRNIVGPLGAITADMLVQLFGYACLIIPMYTLAVGLSTLHKANSSRRGRRTQKRFGLIFVLIAASLLITGADDLTPSDFEPNAGGFWSLLVLNAIKSMHATVGVSYSPLIGFALLNVAAAILIQWRSRSAPLPKIDFESVRGILKSPVDAIPAKEIFKSAFMPTLLSQKGVVFRKRIPRKAPELAGPQLRPKGRHIRRIQRALDRRRKPFRMRS